MTQRLTNILLLISRLHIIEKNIQNVKKNKEKHRERDALAVFVNFRYKDFYFLRGFRFALFF